MTKQNAEGLIITIYDCLQVDAGMNLILDHDKIPSIYFPVHYSLIIQQYCDVINNADTLVTISMVMRATMYVSNVSRVTSFDCGLLC
jgi:hypothetical protein